MVVPLRNRLNVILLELTDRVLHALKHVGVKLGVVDLELGKARAERLLHIVEGLHDLDQRHVLLVVLLEVRLHLHRALLPQSRRSRLVLPNSRRNPQSHSCYVSIVF